MSPRQSLNVLKAQVLSHVQDMNAVSAAEENLCVIECPGNQNPCIGLSMVTVILKQMPLLSQPEGRC